MAPVNWRAVYKSLTRGRRFQQPRNYFFMSLPPIHSSVMNLQHLPPRSQRVISVFNAPPIPVYYVQVPQAALANIRGSLASPPPVYVHLLRLVQANNDLVVDGLYMACRTGMDIIPGASYATTMLPSIFALNPPQMTQRVGTSYSACACAH